VCLSQPGPRFSTLYVVVFFMFIDNVIVLSMLMLLFIYTAIVLSMLMLLFIDTAVVLSMLMLLFIYTVIVLSMLMLLFIDTAVVLSMLMLLFIDTAIVLSMLMLLFIFVIVCGLFEWRQIYMQGFHRLFIHMYIYCYWISSYQEWRVRINRFNPLYIFFCPKPGPRFPTSYVLVFFCVQWVKLKSDC
jgi:hypothetical protein